MSSFEVSLGRAVHISQVITDYVDNEYYDSVSYQSYLPSYRASTLYQRDLEEYKIILKKKISFIVKPFFKENSLSSISKIILEYLDFNHIAEMEYDTMPIVMNAPMPVMEEAPRCRMRSQITHFFFVQIYGTSPTKLIFLDIDETVRGRTKEFLAEDQRIYRQDPIAYFEKLHGPFNDQALGHLGTLLREYPEAAIILTTNLKNMRSPTLCRNQFPPLIANRIFDKIVDKMEHEREYEICMKYAPQYVAYMTEDELNKILGMNKEHYEYWQVLKDNFLRRSTKILDYLDNYDEAQGAFSPEYYNYVIFDDLYLEHYESHYAFNIDEMSWHKHQVFYGRFIWVDQEDLLTEDDVEQAICLLREEAL